MLAVLFAERVILGKMFFETDDPDKLVPPGLRAAVAKELLSYGLDYLVPDEYK